MNKLFLILILQTFLFSSSSILIINSYHKGYTWSDDVINGIEDSLYKSNDIDTNILYMDSKRITSKEYYNNLKNLYRIQLENQKYDLIIAIDRFAYDFVLNSYDQFFKDEKVLAVGLENFSIDKVKTYGLENKVSVLLEKRDLKSNVQIIEKINPSLKKLYIVNDKSPNALHTQPQILNLLNTYKHDYEIIYLQVNSLEELVKIFSTKEQGTAALFIRFYKNADGKLNKNYDISHFIKNSKVPVFITDSIFMNKGATGGKIIDLYKLGETSGKMAMNILSGNKSEVINFNDLYLVFDQQKLEQFTFPLLNIDEEYKIVNKRETFFDRNRSFIDFIFRISPLFLLFMFGLIHNIYKRRELEKKLRQRIYFDEVLLNAIDSPIFWEDDEGLIVDANKGFCSLVNIEYIQLHGKKLKDLSDNKKIKKILKVLEDYRKYDIKQYEFKYQDINNNKKIFLLKQEKFEDKKLQQQGFVTIFTDITHERENELEKQRDRQFTIQQSKLAEIGEVFSSIAHQWKSPLVEITAIAQEQFYTNKNINRESNNKNLKEDDSFVSDIMKQVLYMTDTINNFQKFIMPSSAKGDFFVDDAIYSMLDIVHHNMKYNNIDISLVIEKNTNCEVFGYKNEFMQSFLNIINNAKEQLLNNDYKNRIININVFNDEDKLVLKVEDNGGGIDKKNISKIFKPYYTTKSDGHGIGLYMAKMIIEDKMDGKIVVNNINNGAVFSITLNQKI